MPIPKHLRHLYRGPQYRAWRAALVERSCNRCEQCLKPNHALVQTVTPLNVLGLRMAWRVVGMRDWQDQQGKRVKRLTHIHALRKITPREIQVVLTAAHLNHTAGDDRPENGAMLCQRCHLNLDLPLHLVHAKETRLDRKEAHRPGWLIEPSALQEAM